MNNIIKEDLEFICFADLPWEKLRNSNILITGATGLIGAALIRAIHALNEKFNLNITPVSYTSNDYGGVRFTLQVDRVIDYIFHCAAITKSSEMVKNPINVVNVAIDGTRNILELAKNHGCKSVVNLSSMEVYGQIDGEVTEDMLGFIDLINPRSCYPESKRLGELLCNLYNYQFKVPVKSVRLSQTFGAGTPKSDTRVFAQFARSVLNRENIILHTDGKSRGNYCYISDTITALFTVLFKGENGHTYNVSSESVTIKENAELLAKEYGVNVIVEIPNNIANLGYSPTIRYKLNTDKIRKLGWAFKYNLIDCYKRMIESWKEM